MILIGIPQGYRDTSLQTHLRPYILTPAPLVFSAADIDDIPIRICQLERGGRPYFRHVSLFDIISEDLETFRQALVVDKAKILNDKTDMDEFLGFR